MTRAGVIAAWTGPALVVAVVARVTAGGVEAPLFVLAVLAAALLALLVPPALGLARSGLALPLALVMTACVLGSGFRALVDLGRVAGVSTWAVLAGAATLVLAAAVFAVHDRVAVVALLLGAATLLAAVVGLGHFLDASPRAAWSRVASRGAFELSARSPWTRDGFRPVAPFTFTASEPQRITVVTAGVYRVTEHDRTPAVVREWRLAAAEALVLRPGDELSIPSGGHVRFEPGVRVPAALASGTAWADGTGANRARAVAGFIGLAVTLAGGAVALVRPLAPLGRGAALLGPVGVLAVVLAAAAWAVYAVEAAPELSIGMPPGAALARLIPAVVPEPWSAWLIAAAAVALAALLVAAGAALHQRLLDLAALRADRRAGRLGRRPVRLGLWAGLVVVAAAAGVRAADGWSLLLQGMGLGAAMVLGPLLAAGAAADARRASLAGGLAGALVFIATPHATDWLAGLPAVVGVTVAEYPALVAVPAAWLAALAARTTDAARGDMVAALRGH